MYTSIQNFWPLFRQMAGSPLYAILCHNHNIFSFQFPFIWRRFLIKTHVKKCTLFHPDTRPSQLNFVVSTHKLSLIFLYCTTRHSWTSLAGLQHSSGPTIYCTVSSSLSHSLRVLTLIRKRRQAPAPSRPSCCTLHTFTIAITQLHDC
jgi:hypothetical protein